MLLLLLFTPYFNCMDTNRNIAPDRTILLISVGFIIVHLLTKWQWAIYISTLVGVMGLTSKFLTRKTIHVWLNISRILGTLNMNILLSIFFFIYLTPLSFLSRIFKSKSHLKLENTHNSLFIERQKDFSKSSFHKMG